MMNPYQKLLARKRSWTPVQTTGGKLKEGAEEAIYRALALRQLELPVGEFIHDALKSEVPETARELLLTNIKDITRACVTGLSVCSFTRLMYAYVYVCA